MMLEMCYLFLGNGPLNNSELTRCQWCVNDPLYIAYHDNEWGTPLRQKHKLFEMLILECMQAGLSWITVLRKREAMREAFHDFDAVRLAQLTDAELDDLLKVDGIIRNRLKIKAVRNNAQVFLAIDKREDIIDYFWQFTSGKVLQNCRQTLSEIPAQTLESQNMAKQLKKDGFSFLGPITCYAFMQAVGMVNDHVQSCHRWQPLACATLKS